MKINNYQDISTIDKEAKKDYIDRHSPFVHCAEQARKDKSFTVKVKVGDQYVHPDDFDHYISYVQLWDGEKMLAQANLNAGTLGNQPGHVEVDFHIIPTKNLKLTAASYCTKHGLWQSDVKTVNID